jgi:hypothetical protein
MRPPPTWRGRFGTRWWSTGQATWSAGRVERAPLTFSTDSGFSSSCRHIATKAWAEPPQTLAARPRCWAGRSAPWPTRPSVWPTWSMCQIHPCDDDDFDIWSTSLFHPLKCSNLVPKFLKSHKYLNCGTRLVNKVNTWLFHTFTLYVGAQN